MLCRPSDPLAILDHAQLRSFLEGLGLSAFAIDVLPDGSLRFAAANSRFEELAELDVAVAGRRAADVFPAATSHEIESYCQRSIDTRRPVTWQWQLPLASATRWWSTNLAPQAARTGHIVRLIGIAIDITVLKDHESARRASESRLEHALEAIGEGFALWDARDRLVLCNRRYRDFYPAVAHLLQPGASRRFIANEAEAAGQFRASSRQPGHGGTIPLSDGGRDDVREEWLSDGRCLLASEGPSPEGGTVGLRIDTTDRVRTERIVRQSLATLNAMMDAVDEMIAMVNSEGVVLAINQAGAQWLSAEPHQVIGQPLATVFGGVPARTVGEMMDTVLDSASRRKEEVAWHDRILDVSVHPVMAEDGTPVAVSIVARDVTERLAAEERAREHQQMLARCMRVATMGEMAAAIAHELSQPITAIITACYACLAELAPAQAVGTDAIDAIEDACREAERAGAILKSVSAFVQRTPTERSSADINALVQAVLELARSTPAARRISFELDLARQLPAVIVNPVEIEQVILNLLRNSIDALSDGDAEHSRVSGKPRVTICTRQISSDAVEVSVRDNGAGFSAETMTRAFAPFFSTKSGGMGMGLAICRTIIDSHGGGIWAEVAPDGGARVAFTLPLKEPSHVPR
jgi:two-component system, LuxR family, sensor kinase FixL